MTTELSNAAPIAVFDYAPTIDGFEVIDATSGRPMSEPFETPREANGHAQKLNRIAREGDRKALARALRSV